MAEREVAPGRVIAIVEGDITRVPADAIVNAANDALAHGGGVDGAIRRAAGPEISGELRRRYPGGTPTGSAVWTDAHALPARWVIHAVGPVWGFGGQDKLDLLASAYRNVLAVADELGARTVSSPAISAGVFGVPAETAADVALRTVSDHLVGDTGIERVTFVLRPGAIEHFGRRLASLIPHKAPPAPTRGGGSAGVTSPMARASLEVLAGWADAFARGVSAGEWRGGERDAAGVITMPWFELSTEMQRFVADITGAGLVRPLDWMAWADTSDAQRLITDPEAIADATDEDLVYLLTTIIRGERFADGQIEGALQRGTLRAVAERARSLLQEGG